MALSIKEAIDLIECMNIQVNYRDKVFLDAARIPKQPHGKGNPKKTYSFESIIAKISAEKLVESENKYVRKKTKNALKADEDMLRHIPDAKEQIAEAFIPFLEEVVDELNSLIKTNNATVADMYLKMGKVDAIDRRSDNNKKKYNRGVCLVYKDIKSRQAVYEDRYDDLGELVKSLEAIYAERVPDKEEYSFDNLPNLLDVIARITTEYCKKMDAVAGIDRGYSVLGDCKEGQITPLYIRKVCAWVCYILLYFGDSISKYFKNKPLTSSSGVCSMIMHDLCVRTYNTYNYMYFAKEKKLLEWNKWSIMPENILRNANFTAPAAPINYAGHKDGYLGFMLQELVDKRSFKRYLEPFGGSGVGITQVKKKSGVSYFLSDGSYMNMCYYKMLKASDKDFNYFKTKLKKVQDDLNRLHGRIDNIGIKDSYIECYFKKLGKKGFNKYYTKGKGFDSSKMTDTDVENFYNGDIERTDYVFPQRKKEAIVALEVLYDLKDLYNPFMDLYDFCAKYFLSNNIKTEIEKLKIDWKDFAVAFAVIYLSAVNGQPSRDQSILSPPVLRNIDIDHRFEYIRNAFKSVELVSDAEYGMDAIKLLQGNTDEEDNTDEKENYNQDDVLVYLDSPYLCTTGYSNGAFTIQHMTTLVNACISFKGDLIYSCRVNLPKSSTSAKDRRDFRQYFNMFLNASKVHGKNWKVLFLCEDVDYSKFTPSKNLLTYMFREYLAKPEHNYLAYKIQNHENLEVMITNFDFNVPDFQEFKLNASSFVTESVQKKGGRVTGTDTFKVLLDEKSTEYGELFVDRRFVKVDIEDVVKLINYIYQ